MATEGERQMALRDDEQNYLGNRTKQRQGENYSYRSLLKES